jgi:hypothetical protein
MSIENNFKKGHLLTSFSSLLEQGSHDSWQEGFAELMDSETEEKFHWTMNRFTNREAPNSSTRKQTKSSTHFSFERFF